MKMTTDALTQHAIEFSTDRTEAKQTEQYTLWQILGIWALAALPMALITWVVAPAVIPYSPLQPVLTYWLLMIGGMSWEFIVSLVIIYRELGTLRWSAIRRRTWLQTPRDPKTDQSNAKLFWWLVPALLVDGLVMMVLIGYVNAPLTWLFRGLQMPQFMDSSKLASPEFQGQWWILGIALVSFLFNYFLGEEFLFRGVLLPKMRGVFGKYDWVANAVLFGSYHMFKPWFVLGIIVGSMTITWPARRFRSTWMAIVVHGVEALSMLVMVLAVILGHLPR
jgi:uncharacterized protein